MGNSKEDLTNDLIELIIEIRQKIRDKKQKVIGIITSDCISKLMAGWSE